MKDTLLRAIDSFVSEFSLKKIQTADEITIIVPRELLTKISECLRDDKNFSFDTLIDVCGVDYLEYGVADWQASSATHTGFSRAKSRQKKVAVEKQEQRFAVVYHLLSTKLNQRIRLKVFLAASNLSVVSMCSIWPAANWFEREAFDLFGIVFLEHPDLRRILTDYGFKGHPFRKDFPLIGEVEMRYDATQQRCVYEPVSIQPRVLVPKVIRKDQRYSSEVEEDA